ncbi:uncharacterized protein LOC109201440 [Oreochromis niloticus]|uniref:uncharacterized protein LOC109201440 n=1 Tax=Oreochromis niloticus TaxID=8128 RepID=UPI000904DA8C|nr:uncharacterized protein LOC109201440 [Oreochromis niloticus]CAI5660305.1 unnamed protein product [Mustela putorius furo]
MICRILLLIILTSCVSGSFIVNVTQTSYQAEENHNITLEWTFTTKPDPKYIFINCDQKSSGKVHEIFSNKIQYHIRDVVEVSVSQDERFLGRVQSDKDALREGRIKLQLSRLRTEDSGMYTCHVKTDYGSGSASSELEVTKSFVVNVTQTFYRAEENQNITLEWTFTTTPYSSWSYLFIQCFQMTDSEISDLYHFYDGVELSVSKKFSGRVQSDRDAIREGRIRLQLSTLRTNDSGLYNCTVRVDKGSGFAGCRLSVIPIVENPQTPQPSLTPPQESKDRSGRVGLGMGISSSVLVVCAALCFILRNNKKRKNLMLNVSETQLICTNMKPSRGQTFYQELVELQINT